MTSSEEMEQPEYEEWRRREQNILDYLEDVTTYPLVEQEKILEHILRKNAGTEYLQKYKLNGATDVETFRERLPVSDYDGYKPYIERIYEGDTSPLLCADPILEMLTSSGTSGGEPKLYPITEEDLELRGLVWSFMRPVLNRAMPGLEKGKCLFFYFMREAKATPGGLPCHPAVASFINSSAFKDRPFDPSYQLTSPDEVTAATDNDQAMYCHLLLGLLQREEVLRFGAIFAAVIIKAMRCLEESWPAICDDITNGTLNPGVVKDEKVRKAVLPMLRKDPALADFVRREFSQGKALDGVIRRLWPNVRVIDTVCTGSMEAYIPAINNYTDNLQVICSQLYAATEGYFGINLDPMCTPDKIYYTLAPFAAYYEFIAVADGQQKLDPSFDEILDLLSVKEGQEYEVIVTTVAGLYRFRMGDILKVVGFYNSTPIFQFMRRMNVVLSIDTDKTDERELHTAVSRGTNVLERELGLRLSDYTSTPDFSTKQGHYVIFWELDPSPSTSSSTFQAVLEQCCTVMESNLNFIYRRGRHENIIGPLELRLVRDGTFDLLAKDAFARGATLAQYKTPRGINANKRPSLLEILNSNVLLKAFAPGKPPFTPGVFRSSLSGRHMLKESKSGRRVLLETRSGHLKV